MYGLEPTTCNKFKLKDLYLLKKHVYVISVYVRMYILTVLTVSMYAFEAVSGDQTSFIFSGGYGNLRLDVTKVCLFDRFYSFMTINIY